jgi:hypothetical protein
MKTFKFLIVAGTALVASSPVFAGRDQSQILQQEHAMKQKQAGHGLAGPVGMQGKLGPGTQSSYINRNIGHPTERVRR